VVILVLMSVERVWCWLGFFNRLMVMGANGIWLFFLDFGLVIRHNIVSSCHYLASLRLHSSTSPPACGMAGAWQHCLACMALRLHAYLISGIYIVPWLLAIACARIRVASRCIVLLAQLSSVSYCIGMVVTEWSRQTFGVSGVCICVCAWLLCRAGGAVGTYVANDASS
jgi:hypothetical protein